MFSHIGRRKYIFTVWVTFFIYIYCTKYHTSRLEITKTHSSRESVNICADFSYSNRFQWIKKSDCKQHKYCNEQDDVEFTDEYGIKGKDKMMFVGKDCYIPKRNASDFLRCKHTKEFNIVNIGGSVARAHFVALCEIFQYTIKFDEQDKHKAASCNSGTGIHLYHMFLPGIYDTPNQTKYKYEHDVLELKGKCKVQRIWDKVVPYNETAIPKLKSMIDGRYSPWPNFDIRDADLIFWSSGVWDVAFKQDLAQYEQSLLQVAQYLHKLARAEIVFRTIPRFKYHSRSKECNWKRTVSLVPSYNNVTRYIQIKFGFSLIEIHEIPRGDEIYDGIHFARSMVSAGLTGECNRAVSRLFANFVYSRLNCRDLL